MLPHSPWEAPVISLPLVCPLFLQPSELFLFFLLPWTVPVFSLPLEVPCSSIPGLFLVSLLPWKATPRPSNLLGMPLHYSFSTPVSLPGHGSSSSNHRDCPSIPSSSWFSTSCTASVSLLLASMWLLLFQLSGLPSPSGVLSWPLDCPCSSHSPPGLDYTPD